MRDHIAEEIGERRGRLQRDEAMPRPGIQRDLREVVLARGKISRVPELRHERHATGEIEAARVVAATNVRAAARRVHENVAAMRADVGKAPQRTGCVAREKQGLVEKTRQQLARRERLDGGNVAKVADPLPRPREHALARRHIGCLVAVERGVQRRGDADVRVDRVRHRQLAVRAFTPGSRRDPLRALIGPAFALARFR
jgi:hypothetical protein